MTCACIPCVQLGLGESQMLDKVLYEEEVRRLVATYEQQFHYGVFYAYMRLREQEVRAVCPSGILPGRIGIADEIGSWSRACDGRGHLVTVCTVCTL